MELNDVKVPDTKDIRHPLGALKYIEYLQGMSKDAVKRLKGIPDMVSFISLTKDPQTGLDLPKVSTTVLSPDRFGLGDSGRDKRIFSNIIKELAYRGQAIMICVLSEAWTLSARTEEEVPLVQEWLDSGDISECPLRQESVLLQIEHKGLSPRNQIWTAPITIIGETRTVGEFSKDPRSHTGRFANLLPD